MRPGALGATVSSVNDRDGTAPARRLLYLLGPGTLVLADRAFDGNIFLAEITRTGATVLCPAEQLRQLCVATHKPHRPGHAPSPAADALPSIPARQSI